MREGPILLIDDDPHDVELTLTALDVGDHDQVKVVSSGREALAYLQEAGQEAALPDLILLDLNMPHMNGIEVLDAIRAGESTRDIPVVILTTSGEERDIRQSYAHGATGYVVKSLDLAQFMEKMDSVKAFWRGAGPQPHFC